jgi:hypothetical protein
MHVDKWKSPYYKLLQNQHSGLSKNGIIGTMEQICQNERTNHTLVTAPVLTVSVHVFPAKLVAQCLSAAASRAAHN